MSRLYEVMFIVRPDAVEEDIDKLIAGFTASVTNGGGVVKNVEKMGKRKLAYVVRKFADGNYVLLTIEAGGAVVSELERRLRVSEPVITIAATDSFAGQFLLPSFPPGCFTRGG